MATQSVSYLSGEDPGTAKANAEYQEALQKMLMSLDSRKNRMFDPTLLAMAEGFLKPAPTFGESLGNVAGSIRKSEDLQAEQNQKLAEARLGVAGKGLELERQRARERAFKQLGGMGAPAAKGAPAGAPMAVPGGALGQPSAPVGAGQVAQGVAQADAGRLAAPMPSLTYDQFIALQALDGDISPAKAASNWAEHQKRLAETERGRAETERAMAEMGERQIYGSTYRVPLQIARQLDDAQVRGDSARYKAVADQFLRGTGEPPRSVSQSALDVETDKARALKEIEADQKQQEELRAQYKAAERLYGTSSRLMDLVKQSPQVVGILQTAGVAGAIGTLLESTIRAGSTTIGIAEIQSAIRQVMPNVTRQDLTRLSLMASELANIELAITKMDLGQQGAITENERAIIRRMGGSTSDTAEALLQKAQLIRGNAEYNIRLAKRFDELKRQNPRLTVAQFERSFEYERLRDEHNDRVARFFQLTPERPASSSAAPPPSGAVTPPARPAAGTAAPAAPRQQSGAPRYPGALRAAEQVLGAER